MTETNRETVACRGLAQGKRVVRIDRWKFDAIRGAILEFFSQNTSCAVFTDLIAAISQMLRPDILEKLGPVPQHALLVMLEMETAGEITRSGEIVPESADDLMHKAV